MFKARVEQSDAFKLQDQASSRFELFFSQKKLVLEIELKLEPIEPLK